MEPSLRRLLPVYRSSGRESVLHFRARWEISIPQDENQYGAELTSAATLRQRRALNVAWIGRAHRTVKLPE